MLLRGFEDAEQSAPLSRDCMVVGVGGDDEREKEMERLVVVKRLV